MVEEGAERYARHRRSPYREPWGGYDLEPPIETPEQQQARVWAIQVCDDFVTIWQDPVVTYTQAYCAALGHIHGRPLWRRPWWRDG